MSEHPNWLRLLWEQVRRELGHEDQRKTPRRIVKPPRPTVEEEDA